MYVKKTISTAFGGYPSITEEVCGVIRESGVREGFCVVSLDGASTGLGITSFWDKRGLDDLMDEIDRNLPVRVNYGCQTTPFDASGNGKGAVVGRSAMLLIHDGRPVFGSSQGLVLLEFDGPRERTYHILVKAAKVDLSSHRIRTEYMGMHDITGEVRQAVADSRVVDGICHISQLHSTSGLLLCGAGGTEREDIMEDLERMVPTRADFKHRETASDAGGHVKTAITDSQLSLAVENGQLVIGENQAVVFAEYDGPRPRTFYVGIIHGETDREG